MSIFGTNTAFSGLGKPSIKLEFESNDELVEFTGRMQERPDPETIIWDEGEAMFVPGDDDEQRGGGLGAPGDLYLVRDIRGSRAKKEPGEIAANKNLQFAKQQGKTILNFNKGLFLAPTIDNWQKDKIYNGITYVYCILHKNNDLYTTHILYYKPVVKTNKNTFKGYSDNHKLNINLADCINVEHWEKDIYHAYVPETTYKNWFNNVLLWQLDNYNKYATGNAEIEKALKYFVEYYTHLDDYNALLMRYGEAYPLQEQVVRQFKKYTNPSIFDSTNLGAPGDSYIITDTRKRARKDLENTAAFRNLEVKKIEAGASISTGNSDSGVVMVPIFDLNFDTKNFQNREDEYSETSVNRIIDAVTDNEFNWAVFDPITVWRNPQDGKLYVLSGHSRSEAFKRLTMQGTTAQGRKFDRIPAKIFTGTLAEARELALNSNTLSTKETDLERANYYRERRAKLMERGGKPSEIRKQILELARKNEGKNANRVIYLSYLQPRGLTYDALKNLQGSGTQDYERMLVAAEWIGHLRYQFPQLTEMHENELYRFLITGGHYGSDVRNFADFAKRIQTAIEKNTEWGKFNAEKSLNLERNLGKSENEKRYDAELAKLAAEWKAADETLTRKLGEFKQRQRQDSSITDAQILQASRPYKDAAIIAKANYLAFRDKRGEYLRADDKQLALFGKVASDALYNNVSILDFNGMQPTYRPLADYSHFFAPADHRSTLTGYGLDDTKKLIEQTCNAHYKECEALARHLKGDCKLQSAFNVWHWLHYNIKYAYDKPGKEEIRTPARVWADRNSGVDCDCLSVLAYCLLKCMGYEPAFELAAFKGRQQFSHIYINLDGIVVDRVWFIFNRRPPFVTKTEIFRIKNNSNLGKLF